MSIGVPEENLEGSFGDLEEPHHENDDDEVDAGDVVADLEEILRARISAGDDIDDGEEDCDLPQQTQDASEGPVSPRTSEWKCGQCFLIVSRSQFGSRRSPYCPSGEDPCESIGRLFA